MRENWMRNSISFSIMFSPMKDDEPTSEAIKSWVVKNMASHMDFW